MMDVLCKESHSTDLLVYLYKLYQDRFLCDVVINSYDGGAFHAHKIVVTAASEYLHKIFQNAPNLNTITLDISSAVLQVLLAFSYTGQLFLSQQLQSHIREGASFLQMYSVLDLLKGQADAQMGIDNAIATPAAGNSGEQDSSTHTCEPNTVKPDSSSTDSLSKTDQGSTDTLVKKEPETKDSAAGDQPTPGKGKAKSGRKTLDDIAEACLTAGDTDRRRKRKSDNAVNINGLEVKSKAAKVYDSDTDEYSDFGTITQDVKKKRRGRPPKSEGKVKQERKRKSGVGRGRPRNKQGEKKRHERKKKSPKKFVGGCISVQSGERAVKIPQKNPCQCAVCGDEFSAFVLRQCHVLKCRPQKHMDALLGKYLLQKYKKHPNSLQAMIRSEMSGKLVCCAICKRQFTSYSRFTLHYSKYHRNTLKSYRPLLRFVREKCRHIPFHKRYARAGQKKKKKIKEERKSYKIRVKKMKTGKKVGRKKKVADDKEYKPKRAYTRRIGPKLPKPGSRKSRVAMIGDTFECCDCKKRMISQYALFKHHRMMHQYSQEVAKVKQYEVSETLKCEVNTCGFQTKSLGDMQTHVQAKHSFIRHNCSQCKAEYQVQLLLRRHVVTSHESLKHKRHECHLCTKAFPKKQGLQRHQFWKHGIPHPSVRVYECTFPGCNYKSSASSSIKTHQSKHRKDKPFTCEFCGMALKTEVSHRKHINKMHLGIRPYLCQICGSSFGEEHELKAHFQARHSMDREYQCEYCPYATSVKPTFFTHLFNVHKVQAQDDKRDVFQCPHCPFTTLLHHRYKTHVNGHTGTREYKCKVCGKAFITPGTLRTHFQWLHSDKVYSCTQCDYQTKTSQKLSEHIRVQHQLKGYYPFRCPYCDFKCATGGNTRKHVKQVHKNLEVRYLRDDDILEAARVARVSGHHSSLLDIIPTGGTAVMGHGHGQVQGQGHDHGHDQGHGHDHGHGHIHDMSNKVPLGGGMGGGESCQSTSDEHLLQIIC